MYRKDLNSNNNWTFELGNSGESSLIYVVVRLQARNKIDSRTQNNATFDRLDVRIAVCKLGSEKYPVDAKTCIYDRDKYDQAYHQIENFLMLHTKTNLLKSYFASTNSEQGIIFMFLNYPSKSRP